MASNDNNYDSDDDESGVYDNDDDDDESGVYGTFLRFCRFYNLSFGRI